MGWASGSDLAVQLIAALKKEVKDKVARKKVYRKMIEALESHDWDTQNEAMGEDPVFDEAMRELNPDMFEEEEKG